MCSLRVAFASEATSGIEVTWARLGGLLGTIDIYEISPRRADVNQTTGCVMRGRNDGLMTSGRLAAWPSCLLHRWVLGRDGNARADSAKHEKG